jgi:dihydroorotate dehydrogenase (NAD+) catalytic subunit
MAFGLDPAAAGSITAEIRRQTSKPLIVKLSPNAPDLTSVALAVTRAGADCLSLVNTFQAIAIDIETARPVFKNITAGLSGPGIKPLALRMVWDTAKAMRTLPESERIPIIGLGGIARWQDAVEFIFAGASAVQVGTAGFANPLAMIEIIEGLETYMLRKGYYSVAEFCGKAIESVY